MELLMPKLLIFLKKYVTITPLYKINICKGEKIWEDITEAAIQAAITEAAATGAAEAEAEATIITADQEEAITVITLNRGISLRNSTEQNRYALPVNTESCGTMSLPEATTMFITDIPT